ncbi:MAG: FAD-dependent oxidoreductase, partial [Chloroflexi bacterium]|nr:FAD-dependent oxidoreductase [Chloroflexota bacterium]
MRESDVAVVGAGPAGLAAAIAAARAGARVTVLDEYPRPGGQYFKQLPAAFKVPDRQSLDDDLRRGDSLLAAAGHPNIELLSGTTVWSASRDLSLELLRDESADRLRAGAVVVATGAYDRPVAFPGW